MNRLMLTVYLLSIHNSLASNHDPFVDPKASCSIEQQLSVWRVIGLIGSDQQGWRGWLVNGKGEWLMVKTGQPLLQNKVQVQQISPQGIELKVNPLADCAIKSVLLPLLWQSNTE